MILKIIINTIPITHISNIVAVIVGTVVLVVIRTEPTLTYSNISVLKKKKKNYDF